MGFFQSFIQDIESLFGKKSAATSTPKPVATSTTAAVATPAPAAAAPAPAIGQSTGSMVTTDGLTRTYTLYLPKGYTAAKKYPLVVILHGGSGTGADLLKESQFGPKADANAFIVAAPDGYNKQWNDGSGVYNTNINDVSFITQLTAKLKGQLSIDVSRMYVTGFSEGGGLTNYIGMSAPGTFAALGPVAGEPAVNISTYPATATPVVTIKGGADPRQPIGGGMTKSGANVESQAWLVNYWVQGNKCRPNPVVTNPAPTVSDGTSVTESAYSDVKGAVRVLYYLVNGMGHCWPPAAGAYSSALTGPTSGNLNATDVIWAFFAKHVLGA